MTQIFLIRHGQAEGNLYRRAQGQTDAPLTPIGRAQLPYLTSRFASVPLTAVYSSDLSRAVDTADAARGSKPIPHYIDLRLREVDLGEWERKAWGSIAWDYPEMNEFFVTDPDRWIVPGAETHRQLQERMMAALTDIGERHPGEAVAVASHGMAIRAFFSAAMNIPSQRITEVTHPSNTAVALLEYEQGRFTVVYENDTSHLPVPPEVPFRWQGPGTQAMNRDLRFTPFDLKNGKELYIRCYADAWQGVHGSLQGFDGEAVWRYAAFGAVSSPMSLQSAWWGEKLAGVIALDEQRGAPRSGWISFLYVMPELRRQSFGMQLLGAAVTRFRELGRSSIRLSVAPSNPAAGFYEKLLFRCVGKTPGAREALLLMEKTI